ncbi:hypothetical protein BDA99DRAFT_534449 [Phascolomyces articulosus]|uniref:Uncharacterized protein n=1 Tax=Phascolomyces articulosus TaxID=60185 RepID=A0AAD5K580_9FUNG|nr:hypothetical protein BDA99DRAFT_534449 [Phascolomyces articulosus]
MILVYSFIIIQRRFPFFFFFGPLNIAALKKIYYDKGIVHGLAQNRACLFRWDTLLAFGHRLVYRNRWCSLPFNTTDVHLFIFSNFLPVWVLHVSTHKQRLEVTIFVFATMETLLEVTSLTMSEEAVLIYILFERLSICFGREKETWYRSQEQTYSLLLKAEITSLIVKKFIGMVVHHLVIWPNVVDKYKGIPTEWPNLMKSDVVYEAFAHKDRHFPLSYLRYSIRLISSFNSALWNTACK